jgi:Dienelactone hydrolase family
LSGGDDDAHGNQTELEAALNAANALWEITRYSGVVHGFTKWDSTAAYSLKADYRSWESMLTAFEQLMPIPVALLAPAANATLSDSPSLVPSQSPAASGPTVLPLSGAPSSIPTIMPDATLPEPQPSAMPAMAVSSPPVPTSSARHTHSSIATASSLLLCILWTVSSVFD